MIESLKKIGLMGAIMLLMAGVVSIPVSACEKSFLGMKPWHAGVEKDSECRILQPKTDKELNLMIWKIVLNVLADLMLMVGYLALGFTIYGGYLYIMSKGDPGRIQKGRMTLISAVTGVVIAVLANVIINTIVTVLTKQ